MVYFITTAFRIYEVIVVIRVLFSWIRVDEYHPVVQWIYRLTDPLLEPIRRILPTGGLLGIDFSPFLLLLVLELAERMVLRILFSF
ncbi:MAG: YggT family protein [Chitinispirillaceae bacterium]|nr:YggT family protein [Chitinispirillaceae bacterium]